ncbi:TPA: LexA family transcriptional regulator [Enterobacter hormaechei]|nr:LexA family transcriptional regulator [Enterobacter hormaechei]
MKPELTPRQNEVFEAIKVHIEKAGFPPTMLELAGLIGCASPNAAVAHVKSLKKKGYITVAPGAARGITVIKTECDTNPVTIIQDLLPDRNAERGCADQGSPGGHHES